MLRRGPLAMATRALRPIFASSFPPGMTQEDMSEAPTPLGKYE